jgi:tripartite-type tricarboxylate transporter receptor subunit TctC
VSLLWFVRSIADYAKYTRPRSPSDPHFRSSHERAKAAPGVTQRLLGLGVAPVGSTADEFAALIRAEYDKWDPVIKAAGIRGE